MDTLSLSNDILVFVFCSVPKPHIDETRPRLVRTVPALLAFRTPLPLIQDQDSVTVEEVSEQSPRLAF